LLVIDASSMIGSYTARFTVPRLGLQQADVPGGQERLQQLPLQAGQGLAHQVRQGGLRHWGAGAGRGVRRPCRRMALLRPGRG